MDEYNCIFCSELVTDMEDLARKTGAKGFATILSIAETKKDYIAAKILSIKDDLAKNPRKFKFHGVCRKSFIRKQNVNASINGSLSSEETVTNKFDMRTDCLICSKRRDSDLDEKTMKLIAASSASKIKKKLMDAASDREDSEMQKRIESCADLSKAKARYHPNCFTTYVNPRNITLCKKKLEMKAVDEAIVKQALSKLFSEVEKDVLIAQKSTTLNFLGDRFDEIVEEMHISCNLSLDKLKTKLELFFGQKISFASHPGKPTIVYPTEAKFDIISSSVHGYRQNCEQQTLKLDEETRILYKASEILRKKMKTHLRTEDDCETEIPDELYKFVSWIRDEKSFNEMSTDVFDVNVEATCLSIVNAAWRRKT